MEVLDIYNKFKNKSLINRSSKISEVLDSLSYNEKIKGITIVSKYSDDTTALEALSIFKNAKYDLVYELLINDTAIKGNISVEGARLINEAKEEFNAANAYSILCNKVAIENGLALEGTKIINLSKNWYNAYYGKYILTNENTIKAGYSLIGANIINNSDKEFKALFASMALCSEYLLSINKAVEIAEKINISSDWNMAYEILDKSLTSTEVKQETSFHIKDDYALLTSIAAKKRINRI